MNATTPPVGAAPPESRTDTALVSVIITVYQGRKLLDGTLTRVLDMEKHLPGANLEVIAVDDGSDDGSYTELVRLQKQNPRRICVIRLTRNYGAMVSVQAGMAYARGDCVAVLSQDLQDTPESIVEMFKTWRGGEKINMTYRVSRNEPPVKKGLAAAYHFVFRTLTGVKYPRGGLGVFLIDRQYVDEILAFPEEDADILLRIFSMSDRPCLHPSHREPPKMKTNFTVGKNIKLVIDNFVNHSYLPVRLMSASGIAVALASICFALYVLTGWYPINQPPGWATIVVLLTFLLGMVMFMLGVIGEYMWRILRQTKRYPIYRIEEMKDFESSE